MDKSDACIYIYLLCLTVGSVAYGIYVVVGGGVHGPAIVVNVALRPDIATNSTAFNKLSGQLLNISSTKINGVVVDVWWGLVETDPKTYNWTIYEQLFSVVNQTGLKVKIVFAFHSCHGEFCSIPLPSWVLNNNNPDIFYRDVSGGSAQEYLSCGVDHLPLFLPANRSAVEMYSDFIQDFANTFSEKYFDTLIYEVQVGLGPDGELRYPSFPPGLWSPPGIGQFQCYDRYLLKEYSNFAIKNGKSLWVSPPSAGAVAYNDTPAKAAFFRDENNTSPYGAFFLNWYANRLLQHGKSVLGQVTSILSAFSPNVTIAAKLGCVYWQYKDPSHAAELIAGYQNYTIIAQTFRNLGVIMDFSCFDLKDGFDSKLIPDAGPQELVLNTLQVAKSVGLSVEGKNTNIDFSEDTFDIIEKNCRRDILPIVGFDFGILSDDLFSKDNFKNFAKFVDAMSHTQKLQ